MNPACALRSAALSAGILLGSCSEEPAGSPSHLQQAGQPWFREAAEESGLSFTYRSGQSGRYLFPEIMGGGAALFDMDADGDLDAYLVQGGSLELPPAERPGNQLFRNAGANGKRFEDVSAASGADDRGYGMGVATGDADGDGSVDLYVTNVGANALLSNRGNGAFEDASFSSGTADDGWGTSAAFLDYDADGDLDLYVVNYIYWSADDDIVCEVPLFGRDYCSPKSYGLPAPDTLFRNEGNGRFTDVSAEMGIRRAFGNGLGVAVSDVDGDGWSDVFVANDGMPNQLWKNDEGRRFEDRALSMGCALDEDGAAKAGMGVAVNDLDEDGDEDLLVVNLGKEADSYYRNEGRFFSDRTPLVGLAAASRPYTRFGVGFQDFDLDGHLDLFEANGRVTRPAEGFGADPYAEVNLLMRSREDGRFEEVLPRGGTRQELAFTSRAAAFGDVDGDGGVDILIVNRDAPAHLLLNVAPRRGSWIRFRALNLAGADALGAALRITFAERRLLRVVRSAYSYCAASDPGVLVGLGSTQRVDEVIVRWPDGVEQAFGPFEVGGRGLTVELQRRP